MPVLQTMLEVFSPHLKSISHDMHFYEFYRASLFYLRDNSLIV